MASDEHLGILRKGVEHWNGWYREYCDRDHSSRARLWFFQPELSDWDGNFLREFDWHRFCLHELRFPHEMEEAHQRYEAGLLSGEEVREGWIHLDGIELHGAQMQRIDLARCWVRSADLSNADLSVSKLRGADLSGSNLAGASLRGADLSDSNLICANLSGADLSGANLSNANASRAVLVGTILDHADLTHCTVYGVFAWDVKNGAGGASHGLFRNGNRDRRKRCCFRNSRPARAKGSYSRGGKDILEVAEVRDAETRRFQVGLVFSVNGGRSERRTVRRIADFRRTHEWRCSGKLLPGGRDNFHRVLCGRG